MAVTLTKELLQQSYELLQETAPFNEWNLPHSEEVTFKVGKAKSDFGEHRVAKKKHTIIISQQLVVRLDSLLRTMAHEMIHVHQVVNCSDHKRRHGKAFKLLADEVCLIHLFDPGDF